MLRFVAVRSMGMVVCLGMVAACAAPAPPRTSPPVASASEPDVAVATTPPTEVPVPALPSAGSLAAGTYLVPPPFPAPFEVTVDDGWSSVGRDSCCMLIGQHDFEPPGLIMMGAFLIDGVYADPCAHVLGPTFGPGVDALVEALRGVKELHATAPDKATVDGHPATHLALEYGKLDPSSCVDHQFDMWAWKGDETRYVPTGYEGHAGRDDLWILDVDGTRVALIGGLSDGTDADRAELDAMIRSIRFR